MPKRVSFALRPGIEAFLGVGVEEQDETLPDRA